MPNGSCLPSAASPHIFGPDGICSARLDGEPKWLTASRSGVRLASSTLPPEISTTRRSWSATAPKPTAPLHIPINVTVPCRHELDFVCFERHELLARTSTTVDVNPTLTG